MKYTKLITVLAAVLAAGVSVNAQVTQESLMAQETKAAEALKVSMPHPEKFLPKPAGTSDPLFWNDTQMYLSGKAERGTERGKFAIADTSITTEYIMKRFSKAAQRDLTPENYPAVAEYLTYAFRTSRMGMQSAKVHFNRPRPYQQFHEHTPVPQDECASDTYSYPSGHSIRGWSVALALAAIDPVHQDDYYVTAYDYAHSRVILGFHYQSDVEASAVVAATSYARLSTEEKFRKLQDAAIAELASHTMTVIAPVEHDWLFIDAKSCDLNLKAISKSKGQKITLTLDLVTDLSLMSEVKDTVLTLKKTFTVKSDTTALTFRMGKLKPGFYQVNLHSDLPDCSSVTYQPWRRFNIGVDPTKIVSLQDKQPDFDEFWNTTLAELAKVPVDAHLTLDKAHSNDVRSTYIVKMKSFGGETIGGILCMPNKPGKYTTYIDYLGYGANVYYYDPSANPDCIEFLLSVRDQGIFKRKDHYRWIDRGLESKENFYYRGAYCDVIRAIDYIYNLDGCDHEHLFARGESQGGAFTWISVSLDHRIKAAAPCIPFLSDYRDYAAIVRWPMWEVFDTAKAQGINREDLFTMLSYFDVKNFTDRVQCPIYMAWGLQDATCPPHTNFAGYNMVPAPKSWYVSPLDGHGLWAKSYWHAARQEWFKKFL